MCYFSLFETQCFPFNSFFRCLFALLGCFKEDGNQQVWLEVGVLLTFLVSAPCHLHPTLLSPTRFFPICTSSLLPALQKRAGWRVFLLFLFVSLIHGGKLWLKLKETLGTSFRKQEEKWSLWNDCQLRSFPRKEEDSHGGRSLGIVITSSAHEGTLQMLLSDWSWSQHPCHAVFI